MVIDTQATPATGTDDELPEDTGERTYSVDGATGEVKDWRVRDDGQSEIVTTELALRNGEGQVGDPVLIEGRRGTIKQFMYRNAATSKKLKLAPGWDVIVRFTLDDPREHLEAKFNAADVDLILEEITRVQKPPRSEQTTAYGVPTDASFGDEDVKPAPDLTRMAVAHIQETDDFMWAKTITERIVYFWDKKGSTTGEQPTLYRVRFSTKEERRTNGWRVVITFLATTLRGLMIQQDVINALVHESLCTLEKTKRGQLRKVAPNWRGYDANVERFGTLVPPVRRAAEVLSLEVEDVRNLRLDLDAEDAEVETGV